MIRLRLLACSILLLFLLAPISPAQNQSAEWVPISIGSSTLLDSDVYDSPREINVWTPPSYQFGKKKYPVLYVLDGGLKQDFHHISGLAQLATINGNFEELIVVGIKTENRLSELTHEPTDPRYVSTVGFPGKSALFLKHIRDEVIPLIEKRFRTSTRKTLIGESLAGLFVAEVFMKHPQTFTDYVAISPSLWWDDKALAKQARQHFLKHGDNPRRLYLTMANEGGTMQRGLDMIIEAVNTAGLENLKVKYVDRRKTHTHSDIYHPSAHDALRWLFPVDQVKPTETPWYMIEGGQPPKNP